jgi:putative glutamine transport system substrate-binding protein
MLSRNFFLLLSLLLLISCTNSENKLSGDLWADIQRTGSGNITFTYVPSEGFSYTDDEGILTGVTIELLRDFAVWVEQTYDVSLTTAFVPNESFSDFYQSVVKADGGVFGVANVTITEERKNELAFSPPYMTNIAVLITHEDIPEISSKSEIKDSFSGLNGLAFAGTLHEVRIRSIVSNYLNGAQIHKAHANDEIIRRVGEERMYFAYVDVYNFHRAAQRGEPLRRHSVGDEASEQFGVIMPLKSDWHELIDEFFEANGGYIQSDRFHNLLESHLGPEMAALLLSAD